MLKRKEHSMIEASYVSLKYKDGTLALKDIDLSIRQGDLVYITGPSGSGKTSLLKLLIGMEYPTSGTLKVNNITMKESNKSKIRKLRKQIGPVFQEFKLIEGRNALENVMMGMRFLDNSNKQIKDISIKTLERVGLSSKIYSNVEKLSWGEAQRVAIARAVARKPSLILADEPTGNLDHDNAIQMLRMLNSFRNDDTTVIITTHATHLIEDLGNVIFINVEHGEITIERRG